MSQYLELIKIDLLSLKDWFARQTFTKIIILIAYLTVLYTAPHSQLVLMSLLPGEEIGMEVHAAVDQFFRIEAGQAKAILNGEEVLLKDGSALIVPAGTEHNVLNVGSEALKLYTIYSPANHPDGTVHATKAEADKAEAEHHQG